MVQLIVGKKGKGKTKHLLDRANAAIREANGNIAYLDKNTKHMYELNNKIRLIELSSFPIRNSDEFIGFICGIISQDHDLEQMYLDSFLTLCKLEEDHSALDDCITKLDEVSELFDVNFIISISLDAHELPDALQQKVVVSL